MAVIKNSPPIDQLREEIDRLNRENAELNRLASFPQSSPVPVFEFEPGGTRVYLNASAEQLLARLDLQDEKAFIPSDFSEIYRLASSTADGESPLRSFREVKIKGKVYQETVVYSREYDTIRIFANDISQRIQAEQELRKAHEELEQVVHKRTQELRTTNDELRAEIAAREDIEIELLKQSSVVETERKRFNDVLEILPVYTILLTADYHVSFANRYFRERFGDDHGKQCYEFLFDRNAPCPNCETYKVLQTHTSHRWAWIGPDGRHYDVFDFPFKDGDGSDLILELGVDITERILAEEKLRSANAYNRSLLEASPDALVTITPDGKIGDVNTVTEAMTGYPREQLIGTDFHSYFTDPQKARQGYEQVFSTGTVHDYELEIQHCDGHSTPVVYNASLFKDEAGMVAGVFADARDISDRKQFEMQLIQSEKHAMIGRMVGSVTHEINNPLQTIKNCLYLLQQDVPPDSLSKEALEMALSETQRLTNIVGQLRQLYRPQTIQSMQPHDVLAIIEEVHALIIPQISNSHIEWKLLCSESGCFINCLKDQIIEVFLNISLNAIEAMEHSQGGVLAVNLVHSMDRQKVGVIFSDTGPGINPEILPRIFEPFITTKEYGLGLGLSICYGIIQKHGGQITVESELGQGSSFTIWLPLLAE